MMNYLIYDCEIIKMIPPKGGVLDPNYQYCDGWHDHANMGISCIGWAHSNGSEGVLVCEGEWQEIWGSIVSSNTQFLIGFNSKAFDDKLVVASRFNEFMISNGNWWDDQEFKTDIDLLELIRLAAYGSNSWKDCPKGHSYALGKIGAANGFPKTGSGELAPKLWQDGRQKEVIEYCLNDVRITRELFELGLRGELVDPNTGEKLALSGLEEDR